MSADGSTIVGWSGTGGQAFRWTEATGMVGLGTAVAEETEARAIDVSADGSVIVGSLVLGDPFSGAEVVAMIWDPLNGERVLRNVLAPDVDLTGWALTQATGVSDDGRTIVGVGRNPQGIMEGWIAVIPEPSTALLVGLGLGALAGRRRATRRIDPDTAA